MEDLAQVAAARVPGAPSGLSAAPASAAPASRSTAEGPSARDREALGDNLGALQSGSLVADASASPSRPADPAPAPTDGTRRPPPRRTSATGDQFADSRPRIEATFLGAYFDPITVEAPAIALYPFRVERRIFPPDSPTEMEIEILMLNASGHHWKDALVILKSGDPMIPPQAFSVQEWRIDGLALLRYRFARRELERRVANLRVIAVTGERRDSHLADMVSGERRNLLERIGATESAVTARPGGLLGLWGRTAGAVRGESAAPLAEYDLHISMEGIRLLPEQFAAPEIGSGEEQQRLLDNCRQAHAAALEVQQHLFALQEVINEKGYAGAKAECAEIRTQLLAARARYDELGLQVMMQVGRSSEAQVKLLGQQFGAMTDTLIKMVETFQRQVRSVDPAFSLEEG